MLEMYKNDRGCTAVRVTEDTLDEVAEWCDGVVDTRRTGKLLVRFVNFCGEDTYSTLDEYIIRRENGTFAWTKKLSDSYVRHTESKLQVILDLYGLVEAPSGHVPSKGDTVVVVHANGVIEVIPDFRPEWIAIAYNTDFYVHPSTIEPDPFQDALVLRADTQRGTETFFVKTTDGLWCRGEPLYDSIDEILSYGYTNIDIYATI